VVSVPYLSQSLRLYFSDVRPVQNFLTMVGSGQLSLVWVWVWKISPKNPKFFNFFPIGSKKKPISSRVKNYPDQSPFGFLFIAGQKYVLVR